MNISLLSLYKEILFSFNLLLLVHLSLIIKQYLQKIIIICNHNVTFSEYSAPYNY